MSTASRTVSTSVSAEIELTSPVETRGRHSMTFGRRVSLSHTRKQRTQYSIQTTLFRMQSVTMLQGLVVVGTLLARPF